VDEQENGTPEEDLFSVEGNLENLNFSQILSDIDHLSTLINEKLRLWRKISTVSFNYGIFYSS
jgi:hypothetical protein